MIFLAILIMWFLKKQEIKINFGDFFQINKNYKIGLLSTFKGTLVFCVKTLFKQQIVRESVIVR